MQLNIVDDKAHRVSDNLHYEVTRLENHPIIVIDDVLENPHAFLEEVVQKLPMQLNDINTGDPEEVFPGYQSKLHISLPEVSYLTGYMIQKLTDFTNIEPNDVQVSYQVNAMHSDREVHRISIQPHVDPAMFATVLYLNPEENIQGGTSFFRHNATGLTNMEKVHMPFKRTEEYWNFKEWIYDFSDKAEDLIDNDTTLIDDVWEEEHHIPMKFNRMIIYPSYMWHSAIVRKGWYKDVPRVSMSGFIFPECLDVNVNES